MVVFAVFFVLYIVDIGTLTHYENRYGYSLLIYMALAKALSTLVKYLYQIHKNYERKSTEGVSYPAYLTDFWGSVFAIA